MVDCDCDRGFSLRALEDGAVVNGRDVRDLGARSCNREDGARAATALHNEREAKHVIYDMRVKRGQEADELSPVDLMLQLQLHLIHKPDAELCPQSV